MKRTFSIYCQRYNPYQGHVSVRWKYSVKVSPLRTNLKEHIALTDMKIAAMGKQPKGEGYQGSKWFQLVLLSYFNSKKFVLLYIGREKSLSPVIHEELLKNLAILEYCCSLIIFKDDEAFKYSLPFEAQKLKKVTPLSRWATIAIREIKLHLGLNFKFREYCQKKKDFAMWSLQ